ncbi:MAG: hypothetical protein L3J74_03240, partial [Bacteroidales bacterium]|nr:hypothetical protein [Bacteroidales bacterium]
MAFKNRNRFSKPRLFFSTFLLILLTAAGIGVYLLFFEGNTPQIHLNQTKNFIGKNGEISYIVSDIGNGIRSINVWGIQGTHKKLLHTVSFPRTSYIGAIGPLSDSQIIK